MGIGAVAGIPVARAWGLAVNDSRAIPAFDVSAFPIVHVQLHRVPVDALLGVRFAVG